MSEIAGVDTSYIAVIAEAQNAFTIEDDLGALSRIQGSLKESRRTRQARRHESRKAVTEAKRSLDAVRAELEATAQAARFVESDELAGIEGLPGVARADVPRDHGNVMNELDRARFSLAKDINDLESSNHTLDSQLARRREDLDDMAGDVHQEADAFHGTEGTVLKLAVYRDLGISLEDGGDDGADHTRAIIRKYQCRKDDRQTDSSTGTPNGNDVHIVRLDKPDGAYADQLWTLASR